MLLLALSILVVMQGVIINRLGGIMVSQASLDASLQRLTAAVDAQVNKGPSTPDAAVSAFQAGVDAQSARLETLNQPSA